MGIISSFKKKQAQRRFSAESAQYQQELSAWQKDMDSLSVMLENVEGCASGKLHEVFSDRGDYGFMLKAEEFGVAYLQDVAYIENVRAPSQYSGGYGGVSFPIFGRVRLNTGRTGGKITKGEESIQMTDKGSAFVTNRRIMFAGTKRNHEWRFDKMMSTSHLPGGITIFAMSTAGKPAGLGYGDDSATEIQFRIELGSALALGTIDRYLSELQAEKVNLQNEKPAPPTAVN